ncbi:MAG: metallophosphoesterase [Flavobacteriaceae bacterium]
MHSHTTFVHLTDLHIADPEVPDEGLHSDTTTTLTRILSQVKLLHPQPRFIVVSGDLTNRGDEGSYRELQRILGEASLDTPLILALGNHDEREGFYRVMLDRETDLEAPFFHDRVIDGIHIITLDSSTPGEIGGSIEPEQFDWLEERLAAHPDLPKLLVVHHAPSLDEDDLDGEWEAISCEDTIRLRQLLNGHDVIGILSGHIHHDRVSHWYGIPVVVGIGQHTAADPLYLHDRLRMVSGASFAVGTIRPSGMTVSFVPQASDRRELCTYTYEEIRSKFQAPEAAE